MATIFTKILNGEIPSYEIDSNEEFYAFLDINPLVEGHTLVIPRKEVDYIFDMEPEKLGKFFQYAQTVAAKIKKAIQCDRIAVVVIGIEVHHAHIHLIPVNRVEDVDFSREKLQLTTEQFEAIRDKITSV